MLLPPLNPYSSPPPPAAWSLQPNDGTKRDGCWYCQNNPGYPHSEWEPVYAEPQSAQPRKPDGWLWRLAFRIWGDG